MTERVELTETKVRIACKQTGLADCGEEARGNESGGARSRE